MEFETYADVIDAYNANDMGYSSLTDYIKGQNIKIKEIEMEPLADLQKSLFENKADGGSVGIEVLFGPKVPAAPSQLVEESEIVLGYRGPGGYQGRGGYGASRSSTSRGPAGGASAGGNYGGNRNPGQTYGGSIFRGGGGGPKTQTKKPIFKSDIAPQFQGLVKPAAGVKFDFLKKQGFYNQPFKLEGISDLELAGAEAIGGSAGSDLKSLIKGSNNLTVGKVLENMAGGSYGNIPSSAQDKLQEQILGKVDFGKTFQKDIVGPYNPVVDPTFKGGILDIDVGKGDLVEEKAEKFLDLKDGGRVGFFMGGPALEGQALAIYNSMNAYGFSDQEIANTLQAQGLYTPADSGSGTETTQPNIVNAQLQEGGGGGGVTTPYDYLKTYTKDLSGDSRFNYLEPTAQANKYRFDRSVEPRDGILGFFDKQMNKLRESKFFQPKIKGTLGTRIANRPRLPLPSSMFAFARSPFNPDSPTYNPLIEGQLNFLEGSMPVTRTTGQFIDPNDPSKGYRTTTGDLIGRDPNTGLLKYGSGSVLAGKNVMSLFETNDYEQALMNYITKMKANTRISEQLKAARLADAAAELKAIQEKQAQDMRAREASTAARARAANPDVYSRADELGFTDGRGGGFASRSTGTNEAFSNKTGRGRTGYFEGGLASMFAEKR